MSKVYYCYSCGEYFKVREADLRLNQDIVLCPHCEGDDTEYSPEEEIKSDDYPDYNSYSKFDDEEDLKFNSDEDDF